MWGLPLPTALLQLKLPRPAFELLLALPLTNFLSMSTTHRQPPRKL